MPIDPLVQYTRVNIFDEWKLFAAYNPYSDYVPVCSDACKKVVDDENRAFKEEVDEMNRIGREDPWNI